MNKLKEKWEELEQGLQEWNQKWKELNHRRKQGQVKNLLVEMVRLRGKLYKEEVKLQLVKLCEDERRQLGESAKVGMKFEVEDMEKVKQKMRLSVVKTAEDAEKWARDLVKEENEQKLHVEKCRKHLQLLKYHGAEMMYQVTKQSDKMLQEPVLLEMRLWEGEMKEVEKLTYEEGCLEEVMELRKGQLRMMEHVKQIRRQLEMQAHEETLEKRVQSDKDARLHKEEKEMQEEHVRSDDEGSSIGSKDTLESLSESDESIEQKEERKHVESDETGQHKEMRSLKWVHRPMKMKAPEMTLGQETKTKHAEKLTH